LLNDIPISILLGILVVLIIFSGFFSGSETSLLSLNRYRLKHLTKDDKNKGALRASALLKRPDKLIGVILLGNNFVNIFASSIATIIAIRLYGDGGVMAATLLLTVVILIFSEITPKTLAALEPERFAFPATLVLRPLLKVLYPFVWIINMIPNGILKILGVSAEDQERHSLSHEELRTVVHEAGALIPKKHKEMLLSIFDLEKVTVDNIMVPRNEIMGIDINDDWDSIQKQLYNTQHTRIPVYQDDIDNLIGILHIKKYLALYHKKAVNKDDMRKIIREPYFIPEGTPLNKQLLNFQKQKRRIGMVVDEYGDIQGLATLDDILEEIVGEFTTDPSDTNKFIHPQDDGTYLIDGSISVRDLNRLLKWELNTRGPKTLNGMILEYLETIPDAGTSLLLETHPIEIIQITNNTIKTVRIDPGLKP
jgi:Mg2+/Co2+ transporter CorB